MSVLVLADLYLDMWLQAGIDPFLWLAHSQYDIFDGLIIAGDLSNTPKVELGDTRILMATLWTDMRLFEAEAEGEAAVEDSLWNARMMPDYGYGDILIGGPERGLEPEDTIAVHERQKSWMISELAKPWSGKTVVITHHAPSATVAGGMTPLSPCFASDLDALIDRYRPDAWIFGHPHRPAELRRPGGTLLRNVSVGYEHEFRSADIGDRVRRGLIHLHNPA